METIKAGTLIVFSQGEYSDYSLMGHFVVLKDMEKEDLDKASEEERKKEVYKQSTVVVIANLITEGYLLEVHCREIHLGDYGRIHISEY